MKKILFILTVLLLSLPAFAQQEADSLLVQDDSTYISDRPFVELDTVIDIADGFQMRSDSTRIIYYSNLDWKPDPVRAVWLAAIFPGLGQIYNRSYWKLPIIYGGLMGCIYAITWNNNMYQDYRQAYRDILTDEVLSTDPSRSYNAVLREGYTIESMGGRTRYTQVLNENQNTYHRYRDISIVVAVAVYALSVIDAFVDAQLFDFDISPDLSMHVEPDIQYDLFHQRSAELKVAFTIK